MLRTLTILALLGAAPLAAQVQTLTTQTTGAVTLGGFAGANSWFLDVTVTAPNGIIVSRIDTNILAGTGSVNVYRTAAGQTFVPNINTFANWTQVGTANVSGGPGMVTGTMQQPFHLPMGTYGLCLHLIGVQGRYTSPGSPPTVPLVYTDANLSLDCSVSRLRNCTAVDPCTGGTSANPRIPNLVVEYTTAPQYVNFSATPTRGASPLAVQFTSHSVSTAPGGIVNHLWDFDNDTVVDSMVQNPLHTYACGDHTVTLTIVDATGSYSVTRNNLVQTDLVTPGFTHSLIAPNTLQFTDTSTPTPGTWAWDLDGDNVVDSTVQNPTFVYAAGATATQVTLTVQLACRAPLSITRQVPITRTLETLFNGATFTTATATGGVGFFDVTVSNPQGIVVHSVDVHTRVPVGNPQPVNVWIMAGSYSGNHTNAAPWRMVASGTGTSAGLGLRTFVPLGDGFHLAPGTYGMAVEQVGNSPYYTNVGGTGNYSNADLSITAGLIMETPIFTSPTVFTPRIWNGRLNYRIGTDWADAGYTFFAPGCAGTTGVPTNTATAPRIGGVATVQLGNLAQNAAQYVVGYSRTTSALGALPLDLTSYGAPSCFARVSMDIILGVAGTGGTASFNVPVPNSTSLLNLKLYSQALVLDTVNTLGGVVSDAAAVVVGQ